MISDRVRLRAVELLLGCASEIRQGEDLRLAVWVIRDERGPLVCEEVPVRDMTIETGRRWVLRAIERVGATHLATVSTGMFMQGCACGDPIHTPCGEPLHPGRLIPAVQILVRDQEGGALGWAVPLDGPQRVLHVRMPGVTLTGMSQVGFGHGQAAGTPEA